MSKSVFGAAARDGRGAITVSGNQESQNGEATLPKRPRTGNEVLDMVADTGRAPVTLMCTGHGSEADVLKAVINSNGSLTLKVNGEICSENTQAITDQLLRRHYFDLQELCPAKLRAGVDKIEFFAQSTKVAEVSLERTGEKLILPNGVFLEGNSGSMEVAYASVESMDEKCQRRLDPLVIHVGRSLVHDVLQLSSPDEGIEFDMLGARNGHIKVRISWFMNDDFGLLALPDDRGEVNSIDQLFADATIGPYGRDASHGYAALAKYDGTTADGRFRIARADGRIDSRDPIFQRLRIWVDRNRDGVAQSEELISLRDAGIVAINLNFTSDFMESDRYGNLANRCSTVERADGTKDLIFDLWFSYRGDRF